MGKRSARLWLGPVLPTDSLGAFNFGAVALHAAGGGATRQSHQLHSVSPTRALKLPVMAGAWAGVSVV